MVYIDYLIYWCCFNYSFIIFNDGLWIVEYHYIRLNDNNSSSCSLSHSRLTIGIRDCTYLPTVQKVLKP